MPSEDSEDRAEERAARGEEPEAPARLGTWPAGEALLLAGRLRSEGINAMAQTEGTGLVPTPTTQEPVTVLVDADQLEDARRILESIEDE